MPYGYAICVFCLVMLNDRERVRIAHSNLRVGRRVKNGGHRDGGKVEEEVGS
jgi:hypothetical protein